MLLTLSSAFPTPLPPNFLPPSSKLLEPGDYSFDLNMSDITYEFEFGVSDNDNSRSIQDKIARLINRSNIGLSADICSDDMGNTALRIESVDTGISGMKPVIFDFKDNETPAAQNTPAAATLGLDRVTQHPANAVYSIDGNQRTGTSNKITINNKNKNMEDLRDKVLITEKNDGFNNYRRIYNDIIEEKIIEGRQGIEQERYLTITIERKNFEEAKAQFATLEATIHKAFIELGAEIVPLNGNERLKVLYDYYHLGDEGSFDFDIKKAKKVGADFKNDLCNGMVKYFPDHFEDESKYCKALFIKKYPSSLSDRFINEITSLPVHSITSIDVVPVPKDLTTKVLQKKYLGIESDIIKQQRVRNKNNDFSTEISYAKRTEKKEIEAIMDDVRENDQCLFFVGVTIILMAESKKELESVCETVETIGKRNSCTIDTHYLKQREALNTALPIGVRQVETMRTLLTQSLAVLMPFNVQELNDSTGNYYGINQISKNVNIGNRKKLINGNGFVFGVPGSGKSFFCKMEMGSVFLSGDDEIIVIDPMNEYFDIAQTYGGTG